MTINESRVFYINLLHLKLLLYVHYTLGIPLL